MVCHEDENGFQLRKPKAASCRNTPYAELGIMAIFTASRFRLPPLEAIFHPHGTPYLSILEELLSAVESLRAARRSLRLLLNLGDHDLTNHGLAVRHE